MVLSEVVLSMDHRESFDFLIQMGRYLITIWALTFAL